MATLPWCAFASGASTDSKEECSPQRHRGHRENISKNARRPVFLHVALQFSLCPLCLCGESSYSFQPCASRTAIIAPRMSFHVSGFIIVSLGNMQPSQQMCRNFFVGLP